MTTQLDSVKQQTISVTPHYNEKVARVKVKYSNQIQLIQGVWGYGMTNTAIRIMCKPEVAHTLPSILDDVPVEIITDDNLPALIEERRAMPVVSIPTPINKIATPKFQPDFKNTNTSDFLDNNDWLD
jgi:hypothetical protein